MLDLGLGDRIAAKGVPVEYVPGWQTRSAGSYDPEGALFHHTAGSVFGRCPSLGVCTYGREGLPGPLSQVLQSREADGWDHAIVIAAGRANHAGVGAWRGVSGNSRFAGLEVEHAGTGGVEQARLEVGARIIAAMLEAPGASRDAVMACQHFEYAQPAGRKIDFYNLAPWFTTASFRQRVAYWIGRTITGGPPPQTPEDDDMPYMLVRKRSDTTGAIYKVHGNTRVHLKTPQDVKDLVYDLDVTVRAQLGVPLSQVVSFAAGSWQTSITPWTWDDEHVDGLFDITGQDMLQRLVAVAQAGANAAESDGV